LSCFTLLADLASVFQSSGDAELWQDIRLKQKPYKKNGQYNQYFGHFIPFQPTAEIVYAHEKPLEDVPHEDEADAPAFVPVVLEEKMDSRRSGLEAPHSGHFIGPFSLEKTICSNS